MYRVTHRVEGVLNPKVRLKPVATSRFNHNSRQRSVKYGVPGVIGFIHRNLNAFALRNLARTAAGDRAFDL
jgi:hypothetical protein